MALEAERKSVHNAQLVCHTVDCQICHGVDGVDDSLQELMIANLFLLQNILQCN